MPHKAELSLVLERFPERALVIREVFLRDESFRSVCEDYALACDCLARFQALSDAQRRTEISDYRSLIAELETEIAALLRVGDSRVTVLSIAIQKFQGDTHENHHRRRRGRRRILRGKASQTGRDRGDPHGRARPLRVLRQLRPAVPYRRRDRARSEPARRQRAHLSRAVQHRHAHELRGGVDRRQGQDDRPAQCPDRRGHDRTLRQACAFARRQDGAPALAGDRPARHLRGPDRAGRPRDPGVGGEGHRLSRRHEFLFRDPDDAPADARRRRGRRLHRAGDGGEPAASRLRGHRRRDARPGARPARPGVRPAGWRPSGDARREAGARRRRQGVPSDGQWRAGSRDPVGQGPPGRRGHHLARRAARHRSGQDRRTGDRPARRHQGR